MVHMIDMYLGQTKNFTNELEAAHQHAAAQEQPRNQEQMLQNGQEKKVKRKGLHY